MILYHDSNVIVDKPRLVRQNRMLDFGSGFGSAANDTIYRTFVAYEDGILAKEETIAG